MYFLFSNQETKKKVIHESNFIFMVFIGGIYMHFTYLSYFMDTTKAIGGKCT